MLSRLARWKGNIEKQIANIALVFFLYIGFEIVWNNRFTSTAFLLIPFPIASRYKYIWVRLERTPGHPYFFLC